MKYVRLAFTLAFACTSWRGPATIAVSALVACDTAQTLRESDGGRWDTGYYERDPLLGRHPSVGTMLVAGAAGAGLTAAVGLGAPRWLAASYLVVVGLVEAAIIVTHVEYGGMCGYVGGVSAP